MAAPRGSSPQSAPAAGGAPVADDVRLLIGRSHASVEAVAVHPSRPLFASTGDARVLVWDAPAHAPVRERWSPVGPLRRIAFTQGDRAELVGLTQQLAPAFVVRWSLDAEAEAAGIIELGRGVLAELSTDGAAVALVASGQREVAVSDAATGTRLATIRSPCEVSAVSLAGTSGPLLLGCADGAVVQYRAVAPDVEPVVLGRQSGSVKTAGISPDRRRAVTADKGGEVQLWDLVAGGPARVLGRHQPGSKLLSDPGSLAFSRDGKQVASVAWQDLRVFELDVPKLRAVIKVLARSGVAFADGDTLLVPYGDTVERVAVANGAEPRTPFNGGYQSQPLPTSQLAFDDEGLLVSSLEELGSATLLRWTGAGARSLGYDVGTGHLWQTADGVRLLDPYHVALRPLRLSEDAFGSESPRAIAKLGQSPELEASVVFDSGALLYAEVGGRRGLYDLNKRTPLRPAGFPEAVSSDLEVRVFAQPRGPFLALVQRPWVSFEPRTEVTLWNARARSRPRTLGPFAGAVQAMAFDSEKTAVFAEGRRLHVVDLRAGRIVKELALELEPRGLALSPSGEVLLAADGGRITALDFPEGRVRWTSDAPCNGALAIDEKRGLVAVGSGRRVTLLRLSTGEVLGALHAFHAPDGREKDRLAVAWVAEAPRGRFDAAPEALPFVSAVRDGQLLQKVDRDARLDPGMLAGWLGGGPSGKTGAAARFTSPPDGTRVGNSQVEVAFEVELAGEDERELVIAVNGVDAWVDVSSGAASTSEGPRRGRRTAVVDLSPGANTLSLTAKDRYGRALSTSTLKLSFEPRAETGPELVPQLGHSTYVIANALSPDGEWLVTGGGDGTVRLWDAKRGYLTRVLRGFRGSLERVAFSPDGARVGARGQVQAVGEEVEEIDVTCVWDRASGRLLQTLTGRPEDPQTQWIPSNSLGRAPDPAAKVRIERTGSLEDAALAVKDAKTDALRCVVPSTSTVFSLSKDGETLAISTSRGSTLWSTARCERRLELRGRDAQVQDLTWAPDGRTLWFRDWAKLLSLSLDTGVVQTHHEERTLSWDGNGLDGLSAFALAPRGEPLLGRRGALFTPQAGPRFPLATGAYPLDLTLGGGRFVAARVFELVTRRQSQRIALFDLETGKERSLAHAQDASPPLSFDSTGQRLFAANGAITPPPLGWSYGNPGLGYEQLSAVRTLGDAALRVWSTQAPQTSKTFPIRGHGELTAMASAANGPLLALGMQDGSVLLWDSNASREVAAIGLSQAQLTAVSFSGDGRWLAAGGADGAVHVIDVQARSLKGTLWGHDSAVEELSWSPTSARVASNSRDGTVRIWDPVALAPVAVIVLTDDAEAVIALPSGAYLASTSAVGAMAFRLGEQVLPFDLFDLEFNRPHAVLTALGSTDAPLVQVYREAWERRTRGAPVALPSFEALPRLSVLSWSVKDRTLNVQLRATAGRGGAPVKKLFASANEVPVLEVEAASGERQVTIPLAHGRNQVRLSAADASGRRSLVELLTVEVDGPAPQRTLYFLSVGVSKYREADYDLRYADKDARELAERFAAPGGVFSRVVARTLVNEQATREEILRAAKLFDEAKVDDTVVLFIAGHGLNEAGTYYFAPHDLTFRAPKLGGLTFADLESLVARTPARSRLVMMDTCHAGPIDEEAAARGAAARLSSGVTRLAASRGVQELEENESTSFEVMRTMFTDLERGTGAVVIAAASGQQLAYEREGNGVFTRSVLDLLASGGADEDADGMITVLELQRAVAKEVQARTGGAQAPTFRRDLRETPFPVARAKGLIASATVPGARALYGPVRGGAEVAVWRDQRLARLEATTLAEAGAWQGCPGQGNWLGVDPTGRRALRVRFADESSSKTNPLDVLDAASCEVIGTVQIPRTGLEVASTSFSAEGRYAAVVSAEGHTVTVVDLERGKRVSQRGFDDGYLVQLDPSGKRLVALDLHHVHVRDPLTGKDLLQRTVARSEELEGGTISPDGAWVALILTAPSPGSPPRIRVETVEGKFSRIFETPDPYGLALDETGRTLAVGDRDGSLFVYDVASGRRLAQFRAARGDVNNLVFMPGGRTLVTLSEKGGRVRIWEIPRGEAR